VEEDISYLRARAQHCRNLADGATDSRALKILRGIADDLDEEAERLETAEDRPNPELLFHSLWTLTFDKLPGG
jgi:hypothetical protein